MTANGNVIQVFTWHMCWKIRHHRHDCAAPSEASDVLLGINHQFYTLIHWLDYQGINIKAQHVHYNIQITSCPGIMS